METVDAEKYSKSVTKHNLYYTSFYGDSKAFRVLENAYGSEKPVKKYECIGHCQKKVETRLQKKKDVNELGGKDRLTDAKTDTLQNQFDIALRQ